MIKGFMAVDIAIRQPIEKPLFSIVSFLPGSDVAKLYFL
jgi:hypothetical protein